MKTFNAFEVSIPHEDYKKLHMEGKCRLLMPINEADEISRMKGKLPKGSTTGYAFTFWNFVGFGCLGYSLYLSFTWNWWAFIVGFVAASFIFNVNKRSNAENVLRDALNNKEFYEEIIILNHAVYHLDESVVEKYKIT